MKVCNTSVPRHEFSRRRRLRPQQHHQHRQRPPARTANTNAPSVITNAEEATNLQRISSAKTSDLQPPAPTLHDYHGYLTPSAPPIYPESSEPTCSIPAPRSPPGQSRHKSQPRRSAPRAQHQTILAQAPRAPAAPATPSAPAARPAPTARIKENTRRVHYFLPIPAGPPREGVG